MERIRLHIIVLLMLMSVFYGASQNNNFELHKGNELFKAGKYDQATGYYDKALDKNPGDYRAQYNKGNSLFRSERYEEAEEYYQQVINAAPSSMEKSKALHNLGNVYLLQKKLDPAIETYKNALRENPRDEATRYNLAYAMELKKKQEQQNQENQDQQQQQQQQNQNNQDQNKNNQEQNDQNKENQDQKDQGDQEQKDDSSKEEQKNNENEEQKKDGQQPRPNQISKEQAERMLDAINKVEKGVKKKVDENEAKEKALVNEEKDW